MKLGRATSTVPSLVGAALGGSVLALSTKALVVMAAGAAVAAMVASSMVAYYLLVATIPVQVTLLGDITVTKLVTPLVIGIVAFNALIQRGPWPVPALNPAGYLAAAFFAASIVSLFLAEGVKAIPAEAVKVPVYAALFFLTLVFNRSPQNLRRLLWVVAITGAIEAIIAAAQVHFGFVMPGDWRKGTGPTDESVSGAYVAILEGKIRAEGTTAHPILLASYFLLTIPVTVFLLMTEAKPGMKAILASMLGAMLYGWFYTFARSSVLGFACMALVVICVYSRIIRVMVACGAGFAIAGLLSYQVMSEWFSMGVGLFESQSFLAQADINPAAGSWQFRLESIIGGWNLFWVHPWFGVGFGQSIWHYTKYLPSWAIHPSHPATIHNVFLEVASELGIFALSAFVGLWGWAMVCLKRALQVIELRPYAILLLSILIGQCAFLMITPMVREIWLTLALAGAIGQMQQESA
ncbi:MAG: O-antigen ligase family protein [Nitrospirota bacterium]